MIEAFVKVMLFFVRGHERRRVVRARIRTWFYGRRLRQKAVKMDSDVYCGGPVRVYCDKVELGKHVCFNGASLLGRGRIRIGHHFHSGAGLVILTENHDYEGAAIPYGYGAVIKDVEIAECVWVGYGVTLLPGTHIGRGAIIQAGSVVHGEIPETLASGEDIEEDMDIDHYDGEPAGFVRATTENDIRQAMKKIDDYLVSFPYRDSVAAAIRKEIF